MIKCPWRKKNVIIPGIASRNRRHVQDYLTERPRFVLSRERNYIVHANTIDPNLNTSYRMTVGYYLLSLRPPYYPFTKVTFCVHFMEDDRHSDSRYCSLRKLYVYVA